jgi:hypothetical protein
MFPNGNTGNERVKNEYSFAMILDLPSYCQKFGEP